MRVTLRRGKIISDWIKIIFIIRVARYYGLYLSCQLQLRVPSRTVQLQVPRGEFNTARVTVNARVTSRTKTFKFNKKYLQILVIRLLLLFIIVFYGIQFETLDAHSAIAHNYTCSFFIGQFALVFQKRPAV